MHYAISHHASQHDFLSSTPRRKLLKHTLLHVTEGLVLIKLGKLEYAVEAGDTFWLPFDTLCAITYFPNSKTQTVELSSRVQLTLPAKGGYVKLNELSRALIHRLSDETRNFEMDNELLAVFKTEISGFSPKLKESPLTQQINHWKWDGRDSVLSTELQLVLKMREASKMMLSGKKRPQVVELLFEGNDQTFTQLEALLLGRS